MYCKKCGSYIEEGMKFCKKCGSPVESKQPDKPGSGDPGDILQAPGSSYQNQRQDPPAPSQPQQSFQQQPFQQQTYQQPPQQNFNSSFITEDTLPSEFRPIGMLGYLGYGILFAVPLIGLIISIVFSFGGTKNINLRNFARYCLLLTVLLILLGLLIKSWFGSLFSLAFF